MRISWLIAAMKSLLALAPASAAMQACLSERVVSFSVVMSTMVPMMRIGVPSGARAMTSPLASAQIQLPFLWRQRISTR